MDLIKFKQDLLKCVREGLVKESELTYEEKRLLGDQKIAEKIIRQNGISALEKRKKTHYN